METELTFVAPEGVYSVTEEHRPAQFNTHILNAISYPTRLSTVHVYFTPTKHSNTPALASLLGAGRDKDKDRDKDRKDAGKEKDKDRDKDKDNLKDPKERAGDHDDLHSVSSSDRLVSDDDVASASPIPDNAASPVTDSPKLFSPATIGMGKKSRTTTRPKNNIRTTTSTFVTRLQTIENLNRLLQNKQGDVHFLFYNHAKNFYWTELGVKTKEPLARITFSSSPTCHDVNKDTAQQSNLDIVIGFNTGDLIWFEPISGRYVRLNKQGCITGSPCTAVRWVPGSTSMFVVAHADGTIIVYDKEREDHAFTPEAPYRQRLGAQPTPPAVGVTSSSSSGSIHISSPAPIPTSSPGSLPASASAMSPGATLLSSDDVIREPWDPLESIFVSRPTYPVATHTARSGKPDRERAQKNPVSHWRVAKRSVLDIAHSSDARFLAAVSEDGCLRIIDAIQETLVDCFASYFGSFTCVAFSKDGKFVLTGGQDDLVTIFSLAEGRAIARCQGHSSFVSSVAFDPFRTDKRSYRFGSVGEDNKLILWDFSAGVLHRPKLQAAAQQRISMSSTLSLALRRRDAAEGSTLHLPPPATSAVTPGEEASKYHPAPARNEVAIVQPVLVKHIEGDLLTALAFTPGAVLTASRTGMTKLWVRPLALRPPRHHHNRDHQQQQRTLGAGSLSPGGASSGLAVGGGIAIAAGVGNPLE